MSQTRNYRKLIKRIEKENEPITNLFDLITPEYILENESKFEKAFSYFTPNEYDKIKDYKSTKAVNVYITKYELPIEEQQYWLKLAMLNNKRIENMEEANLEYIKSLDTEFAYEVLLKIGYTDDIKYSPKEQKNLKFYKKLACNNFDYLGELVIKHSLVEPYTLRLFYTSTTIDSTNKVYKHIAKMYAINPTFMICYVLNKQPTKKALRTVIDENMIGILNDCTLLTFLLQKYESSNNKMDIIQILMKQNRKIDTVEEFVLNNVQIPERIAKLLSIIAGFLSNDTDWFAIFYHEDVPYQKYTELYHKMHRINHKVKLDFDRIEYFMQYAFYKTNFTATFDPLNYDTVSPNDFLKKHLSQRDDIDFYCKLPDTVKNNINPIFRDSPEYMRDKKRAAEYYKSFKNFTPQLLDSKLGILYIEQNLNKLPVEKAKAIIVANKSLDHPLNIYLDEYIWNNYPCISSFYTEFKKQHDNNLNNIINQIDCKLNFDVYVKYKSYESECSRHLSETYTLADMIKNYHKSPELVTKALSYKLEKDLDQVINFLLGKPAYKPILHDLVNTVDDKYVAQIFDIIINNHKNDKDLIFMLASKDTSLLGRVLVAIKDNCTVEDARKINVLITENDINVDYSGNLFFNIATNNDPTMIASSDNNLKYLLEIHDFYKPYIISNFGYICTQINSGCNDDWVIRCIETICADDALLFLVKDDIKRIFYENPETKILQHLSNSNGYFTKELFNLSKHFVTAKAANRVLQTTNTDDFLKLPDKDLIGTLHSMTFDCYLDDVSADYLLLRLDTLLFAMQKTTYEREFCKNVFRSIYTLDEIVYNCNYDLILINLINLISDDRFTSELADIFDKLATKDVKIIETLVFMLDKDINISKIVVSILMRIEKDDSEYVEKICSSILASPNLDNQADDSKAVINFLAYAPALKSFAKYKNNFLSELKQIYLGNNVEIAMKAFSKLYSDEIRNFIISASFMHARKSEALNIIEKNFDADDINIFALIYILKFDKNEKIRSKAHELWIKNFKQGVINAVIPYIIIMCHYHREDDLLFEYAIHDFISKYSYNIEKEIITLIKYLKSREDTAHPKIDALGHVSCLHNCVDDFELSLTESVCYFIKEGLKLDLLKDAAIEFLQLNVDIEIVQDLLHEPKYQDVLLSMILDNKIEFEVVLTNKGFVDEIYKKTGDEKLLPYLSTSLKMKELPKDVDNIDKIFSNTAPSKEWELFLSNNDPAFSKSYLKNYVCDFGGLKVIFDRVCEECTDIDDLIDIFYIDYLKYVSYKNFKDIKKLVKLLIETRNYKRLRELQDHIDFETLCQLLRLSLEETDIASVLGGYDYQNEVINDYIDIMNK